MKCALLRSTYEQGNPLPVDPLTEEVRFSVLAIGNDDDGTPLDFYSAPDWSKLRRLEKRLHELHKLVRKAEDDPDGMDNEYQGEIRDVTRQLRREIDKAYMWVRAWDENCAGAPPWPIPKDESDD
jgi:hypothetical protein